MLFFCAVLDIRLLQLDQSVLTFGSSNTPAHEPLTPFTATKGSSEGFSGISIESWLFKKILDPGTTKQPVFGVLKCAVHI